MPDQPCNVSEQLDRATRPVLLIPSTERLTNWPQPGQIIRVRNPGGVACLTLGAVPTWERARRLLEEPDA